MKQSLYFLLLMPHLLLAQIIPWDTARRFSAMAGSALTNAAVALSPDGATYLTGNFRDAATFDTLTLSAPEAGRDYGYLVKLNTAFQVEWGQVFEQKAYTVTTDLQGNVFVAGSHLKTVQSQDSLCFVAKYDASGKLLDTFTSVGGGGHVRVVRADAAGNCYLAGWMNAPTTFTGLSPGSVNGRDNFLVKLSPDLSQVHWATLTGSSNQLDEVYDMEISADGFIYTSGNYSQAFNILCFCYNGDFFVEKHNPATGASIWRRIANSGSGTSTQNLLSASADGQSIFMSGSFKHTTTFAPGISLTAEAGTDDYHIFLSEYSGAGTVQWAKKISFVGDSYPQGLVMADNKLVLHGYNVSTALMGTFLLTPQGGADPFSVEIKPTDGTVEFAEAFSGAGADRGFGIDARDGVLAVSGNAASNSLTIGDFTLPGNANSVYVARKYFKAPLSIQLSHLMPVSCAGAADGSVTAGAQGGLPPYTFQWSNNANTPAIANLGPGTYTVTVTDQNGAQLTATATIIEPPPLELQLTNITPASCAGGGSIRVNAVGGNGSYSYIWNNGLSGDHIEGLQADTYTVTVSDASGCTASLTAAVSGESDTEAPVISGKDIIVELGTSGMIVLSAEILEISITDNCGVATELIEPAMFDCDDIGQHQVTVGATDEAGNTSELTLTVTIADKTPPVVTCPANITACAAENRVEYDAPVATDNCLKMGGPEGQWELEAGLSSGAEFPAGETTLVAYTYTDPSGNAGYCSFEVTIAPEIGIALDSVSPDKGGAGLGNIQVTVSGSTGPFSFEWFHNGALVSQEEDPGGLGIGFYSLIVTDNMGCTAELSQVFVDNLSKTAEPKAGVFQLQPNPASGPVRIVFPEPVNGPFHITLTDSWGRLVAQWNDQRKQEALTFDCSGLSSGVYVVVVSSARGMGQMRLVVQR